MTAQELYDKFRYQWFEPLADNYRESLYINGADYAKKAYKIFSWNDIASFALVDRPSFSYYKNMEGDWKQNSQGGAGYLLVLIAGIPYWADAVGQIPFAVDTFRDTKNIINTVKTGMKWGTGTLTGEMDHSNEYDNYFVLRGAIFSSKKFSYEIKSSDKSYSSVVSTEINNYIDPATLSNPINNDELMKYGIWKE